MDLLVSSLQIRAADIFKPTPAAVLVNNSVEIESIIELLNKITASSNNKIDSLSGDQNSARDELRLGEIVQFVVDIDLIGEEKSIKALQAKADESKVDLTKLDSQIQSIESEVEDLRIKLKDERKGADKVNEYLNHYFGHDNLRLEAIEDNETSTFKFKIMRSKELAYNLSEGECSLVAFCYFIAKLEDVETKGKKLVICIDDPVSSLDSNHIFFVFSLIENLITKPVIDTSGKKTYRYEQLFVSTHNLEFLKYLKKLSRPKSDYEQFLVLAREGISTLELMPPYLRNYITEFNYLFGEIHTCTDPGNASSEHHCFYNFGNNLRKFLEAFLFFKFPISVGDQAHYNRRIEEFFKEEPGTESFVQRLTNEFSHLSEIFDRSAQPIDYDEISRLARFVLLKIKESDISQYKCLLESIDKPDPLDT